MTLIKEFSKLPIVGFGLSGLILRPNLFLHMSFFGIGPYSSGERAVLESTLQISRCREVDIALEYRGPIEVRELLERRIPSVAEMAVAPVSSMKEFLVRFNEGSIRVTAVDYVYSVVREDPFSEYDENRYQKS